MELIGQEQIHSVFAKILRKEANKIGFNNQFTILDNEDSKTMIKRIIQDHRLDKEILQTKFNLF